MCQGTHASRQGPTRHIVDLFGQEHIPLSFEIFPPKGEFTLDEAHDVLAGLTPLDPAFVSVTYSAGGSGNSGHTSEIAQMGTREFGLTTMAHLTCMDATRQSTADTIALMKERGIENVLALRGDPAPGMTTHDYRYASDLIPELREAGFCVGATAYPEGHIECFDLAEDIRHLKLKEDAGAQFFVAQLFFENRLAYDFLDRCRAARIRVPITFGIMPFMSKSQIARMVFLCGASLPAPVVKLLAKWEYDEVSLRQAGIDYAIGQICDLADHGVDGVHLYTMNKPDVAREIVDAVRSSL